MIRETAPSLMQLQRKEVPRRISWQWQQVLHVGYEEKDLVHQR